MSDLLVLCGRAAKVKVTQYEHCLEEDRLFKHIAALNTHGAYGVQVDACRPTESEDDVWLGSFLLLRDCSRSAGPSD